MTSGKISIFQSALPDRTRTTESGSDRLSGFGPGISFRKIAGDPPPQTGEGITLSPRRRAQAATFSTYLLKACEKPANLEELQALQAELPLARIETSATARANVRMAAHSLRLLFQAVDSGNVAKVQDLALLLMPALTAVLEDKSTASGHVASDRAAILLVALFR